ncbi:hypothetical protein ACLB1E_10850 [Escherichia coli]
MIASQLARYPLLLDELLDPNTLYQPTATDAYRDELRQNFRCACRKMTKSNSLRRCVSSNRRSCYASPQRISPVHYR